MCLLRRDLCLAALFLWIKPLITNLSIIDIASLKLALDWSLFFSAKDFRTFLMLDLKLDF